MIVILELIALGIFALIAFNLWKAFTGGGQVEAQRGGPIIEVFSLLIIVFLLGLYVE